MHFLKKALPFIYTFIACAIFTACFTKGENKSDIILETGDAKLTRQEWAKQAKMYAAAYQQKYHADVSADSIKNAAEEFINYAYVLAGAYDKGYDKSPEVTEKVLETSKFMMGQKNGDLYKQSIVSKVAITDADISNAIANSKKAISLSVLKFKNKQAMLAVLGKDTLLKNAVDFEKAAAKCKTQLGAMVIKSKLFLPSDNFLLLQNQIIKMKDGECSAPVLSSDGPYNTALYIIRKEKTEPSAGLNVKDTDRIKQMLQSFAEEKLYTQYVQDKLKSSAFVIDESTVNQLASQVSYTAKIEMEKNSVSNLLTRKALSYQNKGKSINYTVSDFIGFYNTKLPIRQKMKVPQQYVDFLKGIVVNDLAYNDALKLGLTTDDKFATSQLNFKNRTIAEAFKTNELFKKVNVSESALQAEYEKNKNAFRMPEAIEITVFTFSNFETASQYLATLQPQNGGNTKPDASVANKGLLNTSPHTKVAYNSTQYDTRTMSQLFSMPDQAISRPTMLEGKVVIFKKEKNIGSRTKSFNEVKEQLQTVLAKQQESRILQEYLAVAKKKYTLKNNFKEEDYSVPVKEKEIFKN